MLAFNSRCNCIFFGSSFLPITRTLAAQYYIVILSTSMKCQRRDRDQDWLRLLFGRFVYQFDSKCQMIPSVSKTWNCNYCWQRSSMSTFWCESTKPPIRAKVWTGHVKRTKGHVCHTAFIIHRCDNRDDDAVLCSPSAATLWQICVGGKPPQIASQNTSSPCNWPQTYACARNSIVSNPSIRKPCQKQTNMFLVLSLTSDTKFGLIFTKNLY